MSSRVRQYAAGAAACEDGMMGSLGIGRLGGCCGHKRWSIRAWH